jgi:hypothetical protein
MKVQNFFSGRLLKTDDLKAEQDSARGKQRLPAPRTESPAVDSFERASASPLAGLLSPGGAAGAPRVGDLLAGAIAEALGDVSNPGLIGRFEAGGAQIRALPEFPAVVELGRRALLGDAGVKEGFLGGLGRLATAPGVDQGALLFHTFGTAAGAAAPALAQAGRSNDRASLGTEMKVLDSKMEEIRNERQMDTTAFQNFDQKSHQLLNLLSAVVKSMNEMRSVGSASRSGL